jgi:pyridoxal phosphate enzyme (YggS family)
MIQENLQERISQIDNNLQSVKLKMASAAEKAGRSVDEIKLVAVTKLLPVELVKAGINAGLKFFGENYPEQAAEKIRALKSEQNIEWHMIGHIQSRKASTVCEYFDMVHSVDRLKIARYLDRYAGEIKKKLPILIEVNLTGEESKFGFPAYNEREWEFLALQLDQINKYENLSVQGLMTMPPLFEDPEQSRPVYKKLRRLQAFLQKNLPKMSWHELSIGTSFDFEVAIQEGATIVRIGTSIFGKRPQS